MVTEELLLLFYIIRKDLKKKSSNNVVYIKINIFLKVNSIETKEILCEPTGQH
jgi:hypothetical protein